MSEQKDDQQIKIVGMGNKLFPLSEIAATVVKIGQRYYRRDHPSIVKVKTAENKYRFFRKESPYVFFDETTGQYVYKGDCVVTEDGVLLNPKLGQAVQIDGKWYRKQYCIEINKVWYLLTDPRLVSCAITGNNILKDTSLVIQNKYSKNIRYVSTDLKERVHTLPDGETCLVGELSVYVDANGDLQKAHARNPIFRDGLMDVLYDFQDKTNPQAERLINHGALVTDKNHFTPISFPGRVDRMYLVAKAKLPYFQKAIEDFIMPRFEEKIEKARAKLNAMFSDLDPNENTAKIFTYINGPWPGKHEIFIPRNSKNPVTSTSFKETGGLQYSFGIEFETSQGLVPNKLLEDLGLSAVGDRSIGAAEYVTPPLQGDAGVRLLRGMCNVLNGHTLVDDRCGLHVHVGSLFKPTIKNPTPSAVQSPSFSKQYLINIINLCAYIEEELYKAMPASRKPTLYHCHSIKRFAGINQKNFSENLGAFIFGPKEMWVDAKGNAVPLFEFSDYKLGQDGRNKDSRVGAWDDGRYKWLNLIHSYTNSRIKTTEFRIFSPTTVFEKTYAYLLLSLALVWCADNEMQIIKPGVTLATVIKTAFKSDPEIQSFLIQFYEERKKKFKRTEVYPENLKKIYSFLK